MSFAKYNIFDSNGLTRNWCTCANCDSKSVPHEDYNKRSGTLNPGQHS